MPITEAPTKAKTRLLLVEDDEVFCELVKALLEHEGRALFQIENTVSLEAAIKILDETQFDLILLDLFLPDSQGMATFDTVMAAAKNIPIVILSGVNDEDQALEFVKKGAQDYVTKNELRGKLLPRILNYALERQQQKKQVQQLNERLEKLSFLDPLTELLNRRGLQRVLAREIKIFDREGSNLVVILLDLDNFKPINDTYGHAVGDIVLQEIAAVLRKTIRITDYVSRIGGDEFLILLPNTRMAEAIHFTERLRLAVNRNPIVLANGEAVHATASFGVVRITKRMPSVDDLLEETHAELSKSKALGKNCVSFGSPRMKMKDDVMEMLKSGYYFKSVKQPIWDLTEDKILGFEFLSRTSIPGFQMPDDFFNFSREKNILSVVDRRCLEVSIAASYKVPPECHKHLNLLPSTIANFQLEHFNLFFPPQTLCGVYCIEISEQQILGDPFYLAPLIEEFRKRNIKVAIDDVGFGRSCLESLIVLRPDVIKIDKRLIKDVYRDKAKKEMLRRLLSAITTLDAMIIAEGIENKQDLRTLIKMGIRYGQGFLWGEPS